MLDMDAPLYAELAERLRAAGLARVLDDVLALARPAVSLALTRVDEATIPIGASKVGGTADLPPGVAWPEWRGVPLPFIAQVRLEEVARLDPEGDLPHQGLLSFFYAINDPDGGLHIRDETIHWHVSYSEHATTLERRPTPVALVGGVDTTFLACAVAPRRRLTLPPDPNELAEDHGLTNDERVALIHVTNGDIETGFEEEMDHRLLGHPYLLSSLPFLEAYLARHGIVWPSSTVEEDARLQRQLRAIETLQEALKDMPPPEGGYDSPEALWRRMGDLMSRVDTPEQQQALGELMPKPPTPEALTGWAERKILVRAAEEEWRLLLQVYSNGEAEMDWAGGGVIHFDIARADLAARDFSRVWVDLNFV